MKLTPEELQWIEKRMGWYTIRYQEIYDEILDHIITAIEVKRATGDNRPIDVVFQNVIDSNFNGYQGIEDIVLSHIKSFQRKIKNSLRANYRYYINWQSLIFTTLLIVIAGFYVPAGKTTFTIMIISIYIGALIPFVYAALSSRKIKIAKGKRSIIKGYILMHANGLIFTLYPIFQLIKWGKESAPLFLKPFLYYPVIYLVLFYVFAIYGLSVIRLCKQEFKIAV